MADPEDGSIAKLKATMVNCNLDAKNADDFAEFEATLTKIDEILKHGASHDDDDEPKADGELKEKVNFDTIDVDKVRVRVRENRSVINKKSLQEEDDKLAKTMDQKTFMEQVERDANERAEARAKNEYDAEIYRNQGNEAFRKENYEKAILHYGRAIDKIKDSPITYNNRALCYIKLRNYKRALQDCQHVLDKLQETNLRSWLYRATVYKRLNDTEKFEESVAKAREHNPKQLGYIGKYIEQMVAEE